MWEQRFGLDLHRRRDHGLPLGIREAPQTVHLEIFILSGFMWFAKILKFELFVLDRLIEIILGKSALFHQVEMKIQRCLDPHPC
jgi:hypothetical protein